MVNTMVYVLAEKYDIPDLKALAVKKVQYSLKRHWDILLFHPDYVDLVMDIGEIGVDLLRRWRGPLKFMPTGDGVFF